MNKHFIANKYLPIALALAAFTAAGTAPAFAQQPADVDAIKAADAARKIERALRDRVAPVMLRRRKADVESELPGRTVTNYFVPMAEELGLISRLGHSVLRDSCFAAAGWNKKGIVSSVAVNVSPHQFEDPDFIKKQEGLGAVVVSDKRSDPAEHALRRLRSGARAVGENRSDSRMPLQPLDPGRLAPGQRGQLRPRCGRPGPVGRRHPRAPRSPHAQGRRRGARGGASRRRGWHSSPGTR